MKFSYDSQQWISMQIFLIKLWIAFFLREKAVDTKLIFERGRWLMHSERKNQHIFRKLAVTFLNILKLLPVQKL